MVPKIDDELLRLLCTRGEPSALTTAAQVFTAIGTGWTMFAFVPLAFRRPTRRYAVWLLSLLSFIAVIVFVLKALIGRGRPVTQYEWLASLGSPTDCSFPSGHAAGSAAFAVFTACVLLGAETRPRFARTSVAALFLFAACVGASRVVLGAHFPSDVLAGAVLGSSAGWLAGRRFLDRRSV